ncbi:unnamed protein product [Rhizoctonia solani]|uniref:UDP-glycosyltransferase 74C1 n=1 Tax=Rhizoctonia solani TaxID=456999 RepID=A0A8H3CE37_9AGAM|nr:unnamed protein product [Rhizoctonia solani]
MTMTPLKHIVFLPAPSWGHLRPAMKTSLRMVEKFQDLFISVFVYDSEVPKTIKYLNSQSSAYSARIKIVTASGNETTPALSPTNPVEIFVYLEKSFELWITKELQQTTAAQVDGRVISKPSWIIEDHLNGGVSLVCKDVHKLPITSWWSTTAASLIWQVQQGNKENGHGGRVYENLAEQAVSLAEAGEMYLKEVSDRLICIPGLPAHHEWELNTQYLPFVPSLAVYMIQRWKNMIKHVDIIICCTTFEMEPISASALSNALDKLITPFFIGPSVDLATPQSSPDSPVTQFLDRAYTEKGAHSVVYVAFGTAFFPPASSVSHLTAILDEIPKAGFRFIFALSSPSAKLEQSWVDAHIQAGNAIFPEWTNQTAVLDHPAIHYFLSHGGWNSSTEALVRGVPMIFWPFVGDQPANAMQIATTHNCGFELLQVRTGPAKSTAYQIGREVKIVGTHDAVREEMSEILELSKGSRGQHQRTNARLLGRVLSDSLAPGGSGDRDLLKLGKALGLGTNM